MLAGATSRQLRRWARTPSADALPGAVNTERAARGDTPMVRRRGSAGRSVRRSAYGYTRSAAAPRRAAASGEPEAHWPQSSAAREAPHGRCGSELLEHAL